MTAKVKAKAAMVDEEMRHVRILRSRMRQGGERDGRLGGHGEICLSFHPALNGQLHAAYFHIFSIHQSEWGGCSSGDRSKSEATTT